MKYEYKSFFTIFAPLTLGLVLATIRGYHNNIPHEIIWDVNIDEMVMITIISILLSVFWNVKRMYKIIRLVYEKPDIMKVKPKLREVKFEDTFD